MTKRGKKQAVDKALEVLHRFGVTAPPVDPMRIASLAGVEVRFEPFEDEREDVSGVLVRDTSAPERAVIGINSLHHPNRQRFTAAHELGHYFLHSGPLFVDGGKMRDFRDKQSAQATEPREIEANTFAAALLMPEAWLRVDLRAAAAPTEEAIEELARKYRVSTTALTLRLVNLGLIHPSSHG